MPRGFYKNPEWTPEDTDRLIKRWNELGALRDTKKAALLEKEFPGRTPGAIASRIWHLRSLKKVARPVVTSLRHQQIERTVCVRYTNHKGETRWRRVVPRDLHFAESPFHKGKQWLLEVYDVEKQSVRTFAMTGILEWLVGDRSIEEEPEHA